jgi:hypothetical protein
LNRSITVYAEVPVRTLPNRLAKAVALGLLAGSARHLAGAPARSLDGCDDR